MNYCVWTYVRKMGVERFCFKKLYIQSLCSTCVYEDLVLKTAIGFNNYLFQIYLVVLFMFPRAKTELYEQQNT